MKVFKPTDHYSQVSQADFAKRFNEDTVSVVSKQSVRPSKRRLILNDKPGSKPIMMVGKNGKEILKQVQSRAQTAERVK